MAKLSSRGLLIEGFGWQVLGGCRLGSLGAHPCNVAAALTPYSPTAGSPAVMMHTSQVSNISPTQSVASQRSFIKVLAPPSEKLCHLMCLAICQHTRRLLADMMVIVCHCYRSNESNGFPKWDASCTSTKKRGEALRALVSYTTGPYLTTCEFERTRLWHVLSSTQTNPAYELASMPVLQCRPLAPEPIYLGYPDDCKPLDSGT